MNMIKKIFSLILVLGGMGMSMVTLAQLGVHQTQFSRQDSLRGGYGEGRNWWDVTRYDVQVKVNVAERFLKGYVDLSYRITKSDESLMQIDLQEPMQIDKIVLTGRKKPLSFKRDGNVFWVKMSRKGVVGSKEKLRIYFSGYPKVAKNAPWDGGWIWTKDSLGRAWATVACQGLGASVWYPCKDHQSDEPDKGASLSITVPDSLQAVGNGVLTSIKQQKDNFHTFHWEVKNPINTYNLVPYIGKYVHFKDTMQGEKGELNLNYWVLDYYLPIAKKQFAIVKPMITCFESWMGPYPFYEDGYKLVESSHLGMEHQSAIAYGNRFKNGYMGRDLSGSGWGLKWDFIIVHESGHEWFGNNITSKDLADMWVHESFTNYTETMFTECAYGKKAGSEYLIGSRKNIVNDIPIVGTYGVNSEGSGDMYYKGASMLHTIRQIIDNDAIFKSILRGLNKDYYHQTVTGAEVEKYISQKSGKDFSKVFDQYLRTINIPELQFRKVGNQIEYKWANVVEGFAMPVRLTNGQWLYPTQSFKKIGSSDAGGDKLMVVPDFYVVVKEI